MPEPKLLLIQPSLDAPSSIEGLKRLNGLEADAIKVVVTHEKLDTEKRAKTFNVHGDHSAVPTRLVTLSHRAGHRPADDPAYRCAFNLWVMAQIIAKYGDGQDWAVLLGDGDFDPAKLPGPRKRKEKACWSAGDHLAIDLHNDDARQQLALACQMMLDGAAYNVGGSAEALMRVAGDALDFIRDHEGLAREANAEKVVNKPSRAEREAAEDAELEGNDIDADGDGDESEDGQ